MKIETIVDFPKKYIQLSTTLKNMVEDTPEGDTVKIPLPSSTQTISDVFTIFESYNPEGLQDKIRDKVKLYSLDRLVQVTNLLQHLDVPDAIINIFMDRIAAELNNKLTKLSSSLNEYIYEQKKHIILPYYEPLRNLNSDVEETTKREDFKIKRVLRWQIQEIWGAIGIHNNKLEEAETIASFLDKNVSMPVLKFIEDDQRKKLESKLSQDNTLIKPGSNKSVRDHLAALAAATMAKFRELYNHYFPVQQ